MDRVVVLERGAPHSMCLVEGGKMLPDVRVAIVHPDTKVPCAHTDLEEVSTCRHIIIKGCTSMANCVDNMCVCVYLKSM